MADVTHEQPPGSSGVGHGLRGIEPAPIDHAFPLHFEGHVLPQRPDEPPVSMKLAIGEYEHLLQRRSTRCCRQSEGVHTTRSRPISWPIPFPERTDKRPRPRTEERLGRATPKQALRDASWPILVQPCPRCQHIKRVPTVISPQERIVHKGAINVRRKRARAGTFIVGVFAITGAHYRSREVDFAGAIRKHKGLH